VNRAAITHPTSGPFWVTHCSMANEMGSGNCGRLIARANLLRFQATWLRAALRPPHLRCAWACFRRRRMWRLIDGEVTRRCAEVEPRVGHPTANDQGHSLPREPTSRDPFVSIDWPEYRTVLDSARR
jgi:hypothetical protein